ncbi:MAG TPA: TonB family protein [Gemmatimonadales bacterium]|nr:TonB family protein [Gemmatimonadales bacterium]
MYDDLERSQRPGHLEWLVVNVLIPSVLVSFALQGRSDPAVVALSFREPTICVLSVMGVDHPRSSPIPDFFPQLVSMPRPVYPPGFRTAGIEVRVFLRGLVDTSGRVRLATIDIVQSPRVGFNDPARHALAAAVFRPARLAGHPIAAWITIAVNFNVPSE